MADKSKKPSRSSNSPQKRSECKPINEVLQQRGDDIVIPKSKVVNVRIEEKEFAQFFHRVEVRSFDDLQELSLISKGLNEKKVQKAIADDDGEALSIVREYVKGRAEACDCESGQNMEATPLKLSYRSGLRTTFNGIRKTHNIHLSRLLSDLLGEEVESDSLIAAITHGWVKRLAILKVMPIWVCLLKNITIMHNATLNLWPLTNLLRANDIRIHVGGKSNINSSYIKVRCASVKGDIS